MTKIKVAIVDDNQFDRYIVKRKLGKTADFDSTIEAETGDAFLDAVYASGQASSDIEPPQLILMDVNMPGRNGFETIAEIEARMTQGRGPSSVVVMMFTSSQNPLDQQKARESEAVIGYICKPFDDDDINTIRTLYAANVASLNMKNQGERKT